MKQKNLSTRQVLMAATLFLHFIYVVPAAGQITPPRDLTFGNKGAAFFNLYDSLAGFEMVNDYAADNTGNIYVLATRAMHMTNGISDNDGIIVKISPSGVVDKSFNGMGYTVVHNVFLTTIWEQPYHWGQFLQLSRDGSSVTVYSAPGGNIINTYRVTKDGFPDQTYGNKGCKNIDLGAPLGVLQDVKTTSDNGVLLYSAKAIYGDSLLYVITKLDANGNIDSSYNNDGVTLPGDLNTSFFISSIQLPSGGSFMGTKVAHYNYDDLYSIQWTKFSVNGNIDSSYGINGTATVPVSNYGVASQSSEAHSILLPDNSLLTMLTYANQILQFKLTPNGAIDSSFGSNGRAVTGFGNISSLIGRYAEPTGLTFWADRSVTDSNGTVAMRVNPSGYIDSSYLYTSRHSDPFYTTGYNPQFDNYSLVTSQHITGIRMYGRDGQVNAGTLSVGRLDQQAAFDASFGSNGKLLYTSAVSDDQILNICPLPDGRMMGVASDGINQRLFRVTKDGQLDKSFAGGQKLVTLDKNYYHPSGSLDMLGDAKGRVIVAAVDYVASVVDQVSLSRYTIDGQLDPSFGQGGYVTLNNQVSSSRTLIYTKFALQRDNKILLLYRVSGGIPQVSQIGVLRLTETGAPDKTFGTDGWSYFNYSFDYPETFTVLRDGTIIVSGTYQDGSQQYIAKLSASGQLLTGIGSNGFAFTVQGTVDDHVFFLGETDSGKIVYALTGRDYTDRRYTLAGRLNQDLSYDQGAKMTYINGDQFYSAMLLHSGRLVFTGIHNSVNAQAHLAMSATNPDLSLDSSFGSSGLLTFTDILPDTLTTTNPYSDISTDYNRGYSYNQTFCFRDSAGQLITAATVKKDSLGDIFLIRQIFNDTSTRISGDTSTTPVPPTTPATGNLVVWTHAFCSGQNVIPLYLYDSTSKIVAVSGDSARLLAALSAVPGCFGQGTFKYTVPPGNYTLVAYCGTDSVVIPATVPANECVIKEVKFNTTTPPQDTTSTSPPNDFTRSPQHITASPNPTSDILDVKLPGPDNGIIIVGDMAGRILQSIVFNGQEIRINMSRLERGRYVIRVKAQKYAQTLSVLKL